MAASSNVASPPAVAPSVGITLRVDAVDFKECLYKGVVGAVGAIPGTACAHPFDVVKMRMQTAPTATPWVGGIRAAALHIGQGGGGGFRASNFLNGLSPAIQQKVVTRAPMFLFSEMSTQLVEVNSSLSRTQACFVGSFFSGFITGNIAALAEYRKVLRSQRVCMDGASSVAAVVRTAAASGQGVSLFRRLRSAGLRNGIFDSAFFGTQNVLSGHMGSGWSYACAAATAVTLDYSVDVCVKRMMVVPPSQGVDPLWRSLRRLVVGHRSVFHAIATVHAGLSAKAVEFSASYFVTGTAGVFIASSLRAFF